MSWKRLRAKINTRALGRVDRDKLPPKGTDPEDWACRVFWSRFLYLAISDVLNGEGLPGGVRSARGYPTLRDRDNAMEWICDPEPDLIWLSPTEDGEPRAHPSFRWVCRVLDLNPRYILAQLDAVLHPDRDKASHRPDRDSKLGQHRVYTKRVR